LRCGLFNDTWFHWSVVGECVEKGRGDISEEEVGKLEELHGAKMSKSESHKCVDCNGCGLSEPEPEPEEKTDKELIDRICEEVKKEIAKAL
jgi:hypothetical protein